MVSRPRDGGVSMRIAVVAVPDLDERLLERSLAPDERGQRELGAGEVDRGDGDVHLDGLDHVRDRDAMDEDVEHRALDRVRVHPLAHREVALRVEVDHEHAVTELVQRDAEVQGRRRLRDAALLVGECDHVRHRGALRARGGRRDGRRSRHGLEVRHVLDGSGGSAGLVLGDGLGPRLEARQEA